MKTYKLVGVKSDFIFQSFNNKETAMRYIDKMLENQHNYHFLSELNDMQMQAVNSNCEVIELFSNKFEIPLYFINLILCKYNLKIEESE